MDDSHRLKIKIGPHEFEAEGPADVVREQFQLFKEMVAAVPAVAPVVTQPAQSEVPTFTPPSTSSVEMGINASVNAESLGNIIRKEGRIISLTVKPKTAEEAVLVILFAQKLCRQNDWATGSEIMEGLTTTGGYSVGRVDRMMEKLAEVGDVIVTGEHRGKRYRLTNSGNAKSQKVAAELLAIVA